MVAFLYAAFLVFGPVSDIGVPCDDLAFAPARRNGQEPIRSEETVLAWANSRQSVGHLICNERANGFSVRLASSAARTCLSADGPSADPLGLNERVYL